MNNLVINLSGKSIGVFCIATQILRIEQSMCLINEVMVFSLGILLCNRCLTTY